MITYSYLVFAQARIEGLRGKILSGPVLCVVDFGHGIDYLEARWRSPVTVPMPASDAGLDVATERARYGGYQERYQIESEPT